MKKFYPSHRQIVLYTAALVLFVVIISYLTFDRWSETPYSLVLLACALGLVLVGTLFDRSISLAVTAGLVIIVGALYIWHVLFLTHIPIPTSIETTAWLGILLIAGFLPRRLSEWTSTILADNKRMSDQFHGLVTVDPETGFDNRQRFFFDLEEAFKRAERYEQPFTLLLIKIDYFSHFKSLYGPKEALHLIQSSADLLRKKTRITDRKFRLDEDTFAVLLVNTVLEDAFTVMENVEEMMRHHILMDGQTQVTLTVSFGYAGYSKDFLDYKHLLQHAEDELLQYVQ